MKRQRHITVGIIGTIVAIILVLPTLVVIPISFSGIRSFVFPPKTWSFQWYEALFADPAWMASLQRSLLIGVLAALLATVCGTAAAIGISRWRRKRTASVARALLLSPVVLPGIVLAIGIYAAFSVFGLIGTIQGFVLAHAALGIPFVVISVTASLTGLDPQLELAASSLGASRWAVMRQITLPLIFPGVLAGALFAFVTSFDEILVSLFIKSPFLQTFPIMLYQSIDTDTNPEVAAASTLVLVIVTFVIVLATQIGASRNRRLKGKPNS